MRHTSNILDPIQESLDPTVWLNPDSAEPTLKPVLRKWIVKTVFVALDKAGYKNPERWCHLALTGSLCTYQYSPKSDIDVSVFVNSKRLPEWSRAEMIGVLTKDVDGILLPGTTHPMQMYVIAEGLTLKDCFKKGLRSAYDLDKDSWIVPPDRTMAHDPEKEMNAEYTYALEVADKMERLLTFEPDKAIHYYNVLHKRRHNSEQAGKGDFDRDNLAYKMLDNHGYFDRLRSLGVKIAEVVDDLDYDSAEPEPQSVNPFAPDYQFQPDHTCKGCASPIQHVQGEKFIDGKGNTSCNGGLLYHAPIMEGTCKHCNSPIQFSSSHPNTPYKGQWTDTEFDDLCLSSPNDAHEVAVEKPSEMKTQAPQPSQDLPPGGMFCNKCKGTGESESECPECGGRGELYNWDTEDYEPCPGCHGTGKVQEWCTKCDGTGFLPIPEGQAICPTCHGTGIDDGWACPKCKGTGLVNAFYGNHSQIDKEYGWIPWWSHQPVQTRVAARAYQGHPGVNTVLRGSGDPYNQYGIANAKDLDQAIENHPRLEHETTLYRGTSGQSISKQIGSVTCPKCQGTGRIEGPYGEYKCRECGGAGSDYRSWVGKTFIDDGYSSCSVSLTVAEGFADPFLLKIDCPPGTPGLFLPDRSYGEEEWVLPRGAHFFVSAIKNVGDATGDPDYDSVEKPIYKYREEFEQGRAPNQRYRGALDKFASSRIIEVSVKLVGFSPSAGTARWDAFQEQKKG